MTPDRFRAYFPALAADAWLDTPGSPPAAAPVLAAVRSALDDWETGRFDWLDWDAAVETAREAFAEVAGVPATSVAAIGSVAEAAATIAGSLPPGEIVVATEEFRSVLWPWLDLDPERHPVRCVDGVPRSARLAAAVTPSTVLVVASDTLTSDGERIDYPMLRAAADRVGAMLFADLTQSFGVVDHRAALAADIVAVHGYKWLCAPRGAAWMVLADSARDRLRPLMPSWKSSSPPYGYFGGGPAQFATDASRFDTSPAWFSWIGAIAALRMRSTLDPSAVEAHVVALRERFVTAAAELGFAEVGTAATAHIGVVRAPIELADMIRDRMRHAGVRLAVAGDRIRIGVHYFNDAADIERALDVLRAIRR